MENTKHMEDDVYLYTLFDKINISKISVEETVCYVYNRISFTSTSNANDKWKTLDGITSIENVLAFFNTYNFTSNHCIKCLDFAKTHIQKNNFKSKI